MGSPGDFSMPPEWSGVTESAAQVEKVNPQAIQGVADQYTNAANDAGHRGLDLSNASNGLRDSGAWTGPDADAFFGYVDRLGQAGQAVTGKLTQVGQELTGLQETLSGIKDKILADRQATEKAINDANTKAEGAAQAAQSQLDAANNGEPGAAPPEKPPKQIIDENKAHTSKLARESKARIDGLLGTANDVIQKIQGLMQKKVEGGYSSMPSPGSGGTAPSSSGGLDAGSHATPAVSGNGSGGGGGSSGGGGSGGGGAVVGGGGGMGSSGGPPSSPPPGNVKQWISEAIKVLQQNGVPVTEADSDKIWTIIQKESGGDPNAINNWDSNAQKGTPSKGLMQCIDPTFNEHKLPGHDDIYDPVDNIVAGVRYTFDRYGGFEGHPGLKSMSGGGGYQGY